MLIRRIARPLLSIGIHRPRGRIRCSTPNRRRRPRRRRWMVCGHYPIRLAAAFPTDPETFAQINAAVQIGGGLLLATGKLPRIASAALAFTVLPANLGAHMFWNETDPELKAREAPAIPHRPEPVGRTDDCVGRHRGQALAGLARPSGRGADLRAGFHSAAGIRRRRLTPISVNSAKRSRTACRSAPREESAAANWPAPPPNEASRWPRRRANAAEKLADTARVRAGRVCRTAGGAPRRSRSKQGSHVDARAKRDEQALTAPENVSTMAATLCSDVDRHTPSSSAPSGSNASNCDRNSAAGMKWPDLAANRRPISSGEPRDARTQRAGSAHAAGRGICV